MIPVFSFAVVELNLTRFTFLSVSVSQISKPSELPLAELLSADVYLSGTIYCFCIRDTNLVLIVMRACV